MITPPNWPSGFGLRRCDGIDSTNEEARRIAASGEKGPVWLVAREQAMGRGRRGRTWVSQDGNLFATLLAPSPGPRSAELGFAAGLAAAETIAHYVSSAATNLKWPNDVLLNGAKAAGILLESAGQDALAIGIGINLVRYPQDTAYPATSIAAHAANAPSADDALVRLARAMGAWYETWRVHGFSALKEPWLARAWGLGRPVKAALAGGDMEGIFEGLDNDGALLLRSPGAALQRITAGEVFLLA